MVVSDYEELGSLFRKKKKQPAPPKAPPSTNFNFPPPAGVTADQIKEMTQPGAIVAAGGQPSVPGAPAGPQGPSGRPTLAPTSIMDYWPWFAGGGILILGITTLVILKKKGKI